MQKFNNEKLMVIGENHDQSGARRQEEKKFLEKYGVTKYFMEHDFFIERDGEKEYGDPVYLRFLQSLAFLYIRFFSVEIDRSNPLDPRRIDPEGLKSDVEKGVFTNTGNETADYIINKNEEIKRLVSSAYNFDVSKIDSTFLEHHSFISKNLIEMKKGFDNNNEKIMNFLIHAVKLLRMNFYYGKLNAKHPEIYTEGLDYRVKHIGYFRSVAMHKFAQSAGPDHKNTVWKIGNTHVDQIKEIFGNEISGTYSLISKEEFNKEYNEFTKSNNQVNANRGIPLASSQSNSCCSIM